MAKDDLVFVGHMLDMAEKALLLSKGRSRDDFERDETLALALTHLVQVIGEAARRVQPDFVALHPEIPWRAIIGMRHRVVHQYLYVDRDIVWDVVAKDLEPLAALLRNATEEVERGTEE
jgi:uncharacterized protein with HEPN domain